MRFVALVTLASLLALIWPSLAEIEIDLQLRGQTPRDQQRMLQLGGDLTGIIVPLVNDLLASQVDTVNSNIASAITDPVSISVSGTSVVATLTTAPCSGVDVEVQYLLNQVTGQGTNTQVDNITLSSFQGLSFSTTTCELVLSDSGIRLIATAGPYELDGSFDAVSVGTGVCAQTEAYTFITQISNIFLRVIATLAFGGSLTANTVSITKLTLTFYEISFGTVATTTTPDVATSTLFGSFSDQIIAEIDLQITNYLNNTLAAQIRTEIENAFASVVTGWAENGYPTTSIPQGIMDTIQLPSRFEMAKLWLSNFFGF